MWVCEWGGSLVLVRVCVCVYKHTHTYDASQSFLLPSLLLTVSAVTAPGIAAAAGATSVRGPGQNRSANTDKSFLSFPWLLLLPSLSSPLPPHWKTAQACAGCATCAIRGSVRGRPFT